MATSYQECPQEVVKVAEALRRQRYTELVRADVTICFLFARNPEAPAIVHHGWPAKALVRVNNLRDRVAGLADVTLILDEQGWQDWSEKHRAAILDHELFHIEVKRNKAGGIKYDDANRPKIALRPHDFQIAGFHEIVRRHGVEAQEAIALIEVEKVWTQGSFAFRE
jgi:hypothetical protein